MKYSDLSDKERYEVIKLGVQNGMTNLDDIENVYNEFANGGNVSHEFEDGSKIKSYKDNGDTIEVEKVLDEVNVNSPKGWKGPALDKAEDKIYNDPRKLFMVGTNDTNYNKWFNFYLKNNPELIIDGWNRLDEDQKDWVLRKNPSAFNLLPKNVQHEHILNNMRRTEETRNMGIKPGTFQKLADNAGKDFLGKSVANAELAAGLISLPSAIKGGLVRKTVGKIADKTVGRIADAGYNALTSTSGGKAATNFITKAVLPAVETKWGVKGVMSLPSNIGNTVQAIKEGDYLGAALEGGFAAFDASMVFPAASYIGKAGKGIYDSSSKAVQSVKDKVNPLGKPVVPEDFIKVEPKVRYKLGDVEINNPNLFYRQGDGPLAQDLIESGIIRTKDTGKRQVVKGINLTKPALEDAMFNKGHLAFNAESAMGKNLITTASSDKMIHTQPRTWTGEDVYINNWKENPISISESNGYIYEPGYGYKKITNKQPTIILSE